MHDVWFGPGLTHEDYEASLRALSLRDKQVPPLLAVAAGADDEPRLVMASRALFRLFGVSGDAALSDRLLDGQDPGARRLATLFHALPLEGAPRLERLRFYMGPSSEIITFLCRRVARLAGKPAFIAAALNVRPGLIPDEDAATTSPPPDERRQADPDPDRAAAPAPVRLATAPPRPIPDRPMSVQAIQAMVRTRWPASRTVRFLWQTDRDLVCTQLTPPLEDVVGAANADLVNRNLTELAPLLDPSGRLAEALRKRATWSGIEVDWPITDAPAAVAVGLGAIAACDRERTFEGYRGYGVVHLDRITAREPLRFWSAPDAGGDAAPAANVLPFPVARKDFSPEDQQAFDAIGAELRDTVGPEQPPAKAAVVPTTVVEQPVATPAPLVAAPAEPPADEIPLSDTPVPADPPCEAPTPEPVLSADAVARVAPDATQPAPGVLTSRADEIGRNGLAVLDRLAVGLLVSRDGVPIFANRHILDMLGFADEDDLHASGGMTHLFGGQPGNVTGSEAIGVRARDGTILPTNARMQRIDWDGLPATLLTLQNSADPAKADLAKSERDRSERDEADREADAERASAANLVDEARRRDESELRELRAILETATDGVVVIDAQCNVLSLNRSGEALFGCDRGSVIGKPFLQLFAQDNQGLASDYFKGLKSNAIQSLLNDGREILVKAHRGGTIPVFMTLGRLEPSEAVPSGSPAEGARFCALFRDLTHWKKVEGDLETAKQDAERVSALKSDFLAKVSHEVRTPLNAIIGFAEVIMEERFGPIGTPRYKEYVRDIHASGTHVMSLVNDLLDLSKIEAGKMHLSIDVIDANKIISECVGTMQPQASRERVIMRLSLAPRLPRIKADERSLRQIVFNLLSNAVKFNEPGGQVIVATAVTEDGRVVIRIRDTGPGMSESDIVAALEPFRQLAASRPMAGGTGLGLPLTKALVEANEATLAIRSKVDQGTLVEVAFPPARVLAGS